MTGKKINANNLKRFNMSIPETESLAALPLDQFITLLGKILKNYTNNPPFVGIDRFVVEVNKPLRISGYKEAL